MLPPSRPPSCPGTLVLLAVSVQRARLLLRAERPWSEASWSESSCGRCVRAAVCTQRACADTSVRGNERGGTERALRVDPPLRVDLPLRVDPPLLLDPTVSGLRCMDAPHRAALNPVPPLVSACSARSHVML